jgi:hypothetical protein
MTITISNIENSTVETVLSFLRRKKVAFTLSDDDSEAVRTAAIRERLRLKYVINGEWAKMNDEDRQDASLLEGMLYDKEQPDYEVYSETDTKDFYNTLKKELHAL